MHLEQTEQFSVVTFLSLTKEGASKDAKAYAIFVISAVYNMTRPILAEMHVIQLTHPTLLQNTL
jgi:hypothetical protein